MTNFSSSLSQKEHLGESRLLILYKKLFKILNKMSENVWQYKNYTALSWQKEASDKSDISRKRAKCVRHLH